MCGDAIYPVIFLNVYRRGINIKSLLEHWAIAYIGTIEARQLSHI